MTRFILSSILALHCWSICQIVSANVPPKFPMDNQNFSVCNSGHFSAKLDALDDDGDRLFYSIMGNSPAAKDYTVDAASGLVKSLRLFEAKETSWLTIRATDTHQASAVCQLNITYKDCGSQVAEPAETPNGARIQEPALNNSSAGEGDGGVHPGDGELTLHKEEQEEEVVWPKFKISKVSVAPSSGFLAGGGGIGDYIAAYRARPLPIFQQDYLRNINVHPLTKQVSANIAVARLIVFDGRAPLRWSSIDSRFAIYPTSLNTADVVTRVGLTSGIYPFIIQVEDWTGRVTNGYVRIILR